MTDELHVTPAPWRAESCTFDWIRGAEAAVWGPDGDMVAAVWGNLAEEGDAYCNARMM